MPLEILGLMVVVGLALVIGAVHYSGGSKSVEPMTEADAINRFLVDFPGIEISHVVLSDNGAIAILSTKESRKVGLVEQMGSHCLTRLLDQKNVEDISIDNSGIRIHLRDATLPAIEFNASDPVKCEKMLKPLGKSNGD